MKKEGFELSKWIPVCIIAVILMLIYKTIDNLNEITSAIGYFLFIISPLLYGILFAYFIYIPHNGLEKLLKKIKKPKFIAKHARGFSTVIVFILLVVLIAFIISFVAPVISDNVISLVNSIPGYVDAVLDYFDSIPPDSIWHDFNPANIIRDSSSDIINTMMNPAGIEQFARGVVGFAGGIFNVIMGLVISLYILLDRERISGYFIRLNAAVFKKDNRINRVTKIFSQINKVLFTFIASKGIDSLINFAVATIICLIFQVPYALLLGLIAGVFNFIPYLGSLISAFIISAITLITCDLNTGLYVMLCLLIFNQLDGNYIEPRIMKSSLKVSPIIVIIAVVIGGAYFNIIGMFLAVPVAVIIKQLLSEFITSAEEKKANEHIFNEWDNIH